MRDEPNEFPHPGPPHSPDADSDDEDDDDEDAGARLTAALLEHIQMDDQTMGDGRGIQGGDGEQRDENDLRYSSIEHVCITEQFIERIRNATLDNGGLDEHTKWRLRNPIEEVGEINDPQIRLSIDIYLSVTNTSEATYNKVRDAVLRCYPESNILSYHSVKRHIADLTGIVSVLHDMCINSCHAFTGPFEDLETCHFCTEPRYDQTVLA